MGSVIATIANRGDRAWALHVLPRTFPCCTCEKVPTTGSGGCVMQAIRSLVVATVAAAAIPLLAATAHAAGHGVTAGTSAAQCVRGCAIQKKACIQTARATSLTCKQDCRTNSAPQDLGTCMKGCSTTFRSTKDGCNATQKTCIGACHPASGTPESEPAMMSCRGSCGTDLADCAGGVVTAARTCLSGCRSATDRLSCFQGCAADAQSGAEGCGSTFETCGSSCP
jgi:hypothetical protein